MNVMYEQPIRSENRIRREAVGSLQRGTGEALDSYLNRVRSKLEYLGSVCQVHFGWYTHRNVAGCWICDTLTCVSVLLEELERTAPFIDEGPPMGIGGEPLNDEVGLKDS